MRLDESRRVVGAGTLTSFPGGMLVNWTLLSRGWQMKVAIIMRVALIFSWYCTVLIWPVLKWVVSLEVFFQFVRMIYHWNDAGSYAGWVFFAHFLALTALTYFVSNYKPKPVKFSG